MRELPQHLTRSTHESDPSEDCRYETQRLLRGEGTADAGAVRVPPAPFDDEYDVRGEQVKIPGKESARTRLFLCFIDLQKAYDYVARTHIWQVLARFGVPPKMTELIRQFHDGIRACVRSEDGRCSEWFEVAQGPLQGCVLSALLFNVFFAEMLLVALERFSEEADILGDLARTAVEVWA